jgi:hypothetical protein
VLSQNALFREDSNYRGSAIPVGVVSSAGNFYLYDPVI